MEDAVRRQHAAAGPDARQATPRRMTMGIAGDIKGIETLAGQAGASATYNCVMCETKLHETYKAGIPHLRQLPEPWKSKDVRAAHIINPPPRGGTAEMATEGMITLAPSLHHRRTSLPLRVPLLFARLLVISACSLLSATRKVPAFGYPR